MQQRGLLFAEAPMDRFALKFLPIRHMHGMASTGQKIRIKDSKLLFEPNYTTETYNLLQGLVLTNEA